MFHLDVKSRLDVAAGDPPAQPPAATTGADVRAGEAEGVLAAPAWAREMECGADVRTSGRYCRY